MACTILQSLNSRFALNLAPRLMFSALLHLRLELHSFLSYDPSNLPQCFLMSYKKINFPVALFFFILANTFCPIVSHFNIPILQLLNF